MLDCSQVQLWNKKATLLLHLSGRLFTEPLERINAQEGPERWQTVLNSLYSSIVDVHCYIHRGVRHSGSARPPFSPRGSGSGFIAEAVRWGGGGSTHCVPLNLILQTSRQHLFLSWGDRFSMPPASPFSPACTHPCIHTHAPTSTSRFSPSPTRWFPFWTPACPAHPLRFVPLRTSRVIIFLLYSLCWHLCLLLLLFSSLSFSFEVSQSQQAPHAGPLISAPPPPSPVPGDARCHLWVDLADCRGPEQASSGPDTTLASSARGFYLQQWPLGLVRKAQLFAAPQPSPFGLVGPVHSTFSGLPAGPAASAQSPLPSARGPGLLPRQWRQWYLCATSGGPPG